MILFPAIDIYDGKVVRLYKGNYKMMSIYSHNPLEVAQNFICSGAKAMHVVDIEGARIGDTPNIKAIRELAQLPGIFMELGGGIRNMNVIEKYVSVGVDRVILGTAATQDEAFVKEAVREYGDKIAVGVDIMDGFVAIKGWTEKSEFTYMDFCKKMQNIGVKTLLCTDISKDGAMEGTNHNLYKELSGKLDMNIVASGGVSSIEDVKKLADSGIYGAIIGKAYYEGAINLSEAVEVAG